MAEDFTPTPEAVEAAARAWAEYIGARVDAETVPGQWSGRIVERVRRRERRRSFMAGYSAALTAVGPLIAADLTTRIEALADEWEARARARRDTGPDSAAHAAAELRAIVRPDKETR